MKLETWQILLIAVGAFAGIVLLDVVLKYRTDEQFRANFPTLKQAQFAKSIAPQLQAEENQEVQIPYVATDEAVPEDN